MNGLDIRSLKQQAASTLEQTRPDYRRLVVLHSAASFGVLLILSVVQILLNQAMGNVEGLSGMGTSSFLLTVQSVLGTVVNLLLPFWELGILFTSVRVVRRQETSVPMLTRGFHRFGPVLRYYLLLFLVFMVVAMLCTNVVGIAALLLPVPQDLQETLMNIDPDAVTDPMQLMELIPMEQMLAYVLPIFIIFILVYGAVLLNLSYRFRMSQYLLLDEPRIGAMASLNISNHMTKGKKWKLAKLELSFWWYYLLVLAVSAIAYGSDILGAMGVSLPVPAEVADILFYVLYAAASLAVTWFAGAYVQTTYACAYESLRTPPQQMTVIPEQ